MIKKIVLPILGLLVFYSLLGCTEPSTTIPLITPTTTSTLSELPPVFDNIDSFHDQSFTTILLPRVYRNLPRNKLNENYTVVLTSETELPVIPRVLNTYRIIRPNVDEDYARKMAKQVGFDEQIYERSQFRPFPQSRYFYVKSSEPSGRYPLEIFQDGSIAIHFNDTPNGQNIPSIQECIDIAQGWLKSHNLYPTGVIDIQASPVIQHMMVGREERQRNIATSVSFIIGIDGYELYGMGAYVSIADNGEICEVYINTPKLEKYSTVNIKEPELALDNLRDYLEEPSKFFVYSPECLIDNIEPNMTINEVSLKYFPMLNEDFEQPAYAQPIYVFIGQAYPKTTSAYTFTARVDAIVR